MRTLLDHLTTLPDIASNPRSPIFEKYPHLRSYLVAAALRRDEFLPNTNIPLTLSPRPGEPAYSIEFLAVQIGALIQDVGRSGSGDRGPFRLLLSPLRLPSALATGPKLSD